jgi:hypothetical protein
MEIAELTSAARVMQEIRPKDFYHSLEEKMERTGYFVFAFIFPLMSQLRDYGSTG